MTSQLPSPISASQPTCPSDDLNRPFGMRFTSTPRGARLARRLAAHRLDAWGIPYGTDPHEEIVLVVGELTANAVRHGHVPSRDFHLFVHANEPARTVRIEVTDTRTECTPPEPDALPAPIRRTSVAEGCCWSRVSPPAGAGTSGREARARRSGRSACSCRLMKPKVSEKSQSAPTTRLLYHGDFDWGGVRSATPLARSVPWRLWRHTAPEYQAAVITLADVPGRRPSRRPRRVTVPSH